LKVSSPNLLDYLDRSEGTNELYEMLRTRPKDDIADECKTFPIDSLRLDWGSIEQDFRNNRRFELVTVLAQVLVRYEETLRTEPNLHLPRSLPGKELGEILMARLMPFIERQQGVDIAQGLRVRLYDFAMALMQAGRDRHALTCLLASRPSVKEDHEFWICACRFNVATGTKAVGDISAAMDTANQIVNGRIKLTDKYVQGARQMLDKLRQTQGEVAAGKAPVRATGLTDNGDGTLTDHGVGLMWQKDDDGLRRTQQEALAYCASLSLGGFSDWRLPQLSEFQSLEKATSCAVTKVSSTYSQNGDVYWTATDPPPSFPGNVAYAADGTTFYRTNKYYVRAVRRFR